MILFIYKYKSILFIETILYFRQHSRAVFCFECVYICFVVAKRMAKVLTGR